MSDPTKAEKGKKHGVVDDGDGDSNDNGNDVAASTSLHVKKSRRVGEEESESSIEAQSAASTSTTVRVAVAKTRTERYLLSGPQHMPDQRFRVKWIARCPDLNSADHAVECELAMMFLRNGFSANAKAGDKFQRVGESSLFFNTERVHFDTWRSFLMSENGYQTFVVRQGDTCEWEIVPDRECRDSLVFICTTSAFAHYTHRVKLFFKVTVGERRLALRCIRGFCDELPSHTAIWRSPHHSLRSAVSGWDYRNHHEFLLTDDLLIVGFVDRDVSEYMYLHVHDLRAQERWTVTVTGGASSSFLRDAKFEGRLLVESHRVQHVDFDLNRLCIRALQVCNGLRMLGLDALTMCEILMKSCDEADADVPFHRWWQIATTVKHFKGKFEPEGGYTFGYSRATVPSVMHVYGD